MSVSIVSNSLRDVVSYFEQFPDIASEAAALAINDVVGGSAMTAIKKDMRSQVDFPSGYLESGRLRVVRKASRSNLEAVISGRDRATSLARFASGQTPQNTRGRGVNVSVKRGKSKLLKRAFLLNLKNGNRGLAVRLKPGESLRGSQRAVQLEDNVYLLYGPSVDQVFRGVAEDNSALIADMVSRRFLHHFARKLRG